MEKDFIKYIAEARSQFVEFINRQEWSNELRTEAENLLIAYDQMKEACEGKAVSTSEKDLRVCDVIASLPSDVEIFEESQRVAESFKIFLFDQASFQYGAIWMRSLVDGNAL